jgi:hypothetical protein
MNPGSDGRIALGDIPGCNGLDGEAFACSETIPPIPQARRIYRGIELVGRKVVSDRLWVQASYVFSSLRGNYDGEVREAFRGQTDPGVNADFDYAAWNPNSYGRLYLDRPHQFLLDGFYVLPFDLSIGLFGWVQSGAPLNKYGYFNRNYLSQIQLVPRGYAGRLPTEWDANLTLQYPIRIGPVNVTLQGYVYNLFNNQIPTDRDQVWSLRPPADYPDSLYDPNQEQSNDDYGKVLTRQDPRLFRAAIRISF